MMAGVISIILVSVFAQAYTEDDIDKLVDKLLDRADKGLRRRGVDETMLGKPGSLKASPPIPTSGFTPVRPGGQLPMFRNTGVAHGSIAQGAGALPFSSAPKVNAFETLPIDVDSSSGTAVLDSSEETPKPSGSQKGLKLVTGSALLPHPAKASKGGEDALFVSEDGGALGVADGVGGWGEVGVDPGLYSKQLMTTAKTVADSMRDYDANSPSVIMKAAHKDVLIQGSCTACVLTLEGDRLHAANLGDSGFVIIRGGKVFFNSPSQQHDFNFPYQLSADDSSTSDKPANADSFNLQLLPGDIVVAGSDGLWDNVYPEYIEKIAQMSKDEGTSPRKVATRLAKYARKCALDQKFMSPFARSAISLGFWYMGGKLDDIAVTVSFVEENSR